MSTIAAILGRLMLAVLFVVSGANKLLALAETARMLESGFLPGSLALPVGIFEIAAGILLALGLMTRMTALLLAVYTLATIFFFHNQFGDYEQGTQALKNLAIAGGLLMVFAFGQVRGSIDHLREQSKLNRARIETAHAEGRAEGAVAAASRRDG